MSRPPPDMPAPPPTPAALAPWLLGQTSDSAETTHLLAANLAAQLPPDIVLALHGDLGTGKTTFVQGMAKALGVRALVTSPTYAIFNIHESPRRQLVHMDAYRLNAPADADDLLIHELLRTPWLWVIEWAEKLGDRLPPDAWHLDFACHADGPRRIRLRLPV